MQQVDHLLLAEVAAARRSVGRETERTELLLVPLGVGSRREQEHDLARRRRARIDELADPPGDVLRLRPAPVHPECLVGLLVGDEQLDRVTEHRIGELARSRERLILVAELLPEHVVHRGEHLGPGAIVLGQRQPPRRRRPPFAEHADVGVPEGVDRLELVPDEEELLSGPARDQVDEAALERVRVLELVDHDRAEPKLLGLPHPLVGREEVAREDLEILEVERRLSFLRRLILGRKQVEELLEQLAILRRRKLERGLLEALACLVEARGAVAAGAERGEVDQRLRKRREVESCLCRGEVVRGRARVGEERPGGVAEASETLSQVCGLAELELELATGRAERRVHARQHLPQANAPVGREQSKPALVGLGTERLEGSRERLAAQHRAMLLVELVEARVDPDLEGVGAEQPGAEAVNRRDPGAVELAARARGRPRATRAARIRERSSAAALRV